MNKTSLRRCKGLGGLLIWGAYLGVTLAAHAAPAPVQWDPGEDPLSSKETQGQSSANQPGNDKNSKEALPPSPIHGPDLIFDDYREKGTFGFHGLGHLSYGGHSNTFHVRDAYLRANYQKSEVQFIATARGYVDTHDADLRYGYNEQNLSLYDYGFHWHRPSGFFVSFRGAGGYLKNRRTLLLMPAYEMEDNPAGFDIPPQYTEDFIQGPGVRLGYEKNGWLVGYSQADRRHYTPATLLLERTGGRYRVRTIGYAYNKNPRTWKEDLYRFGGQVSLMYLFPLAGQWRLEALLESGYDDRDGTRSRFEQALVYGQWRMGLRQILAYDLDEPFLFEGSLAYHIDFLQIGLFAASDERIYLASRMSF